MKNYLKKISNIVENEIRNYLDDLKYPPTISEGMRYAMLGGGKRIRPALLLMTLELFETNIDLGLPSAVAVEFIHTYSLVHDDLPAIDNDDYRRGRLTVHKKFGEAAAILIGDALLTYAFYILSSKNNLIEHSKIVKIIEKTSIAAGIQGMIGGQMIDIESENKIIDLPTLQYIHTHKTGMMIRLPVEIGTIICNADEKSKNALISYADLIGLAFQIKDDILDVEGEFEKTGKSIHSDENNKKSTYPSIFGLEKSKEILNDKISEAKNIIKLTFPNKNIETFIKLANFIAEREN